MRRFIEKNKSIQETPQHPCVSVDVRNNDKVNIDLKRAISGNVYVKCIWSNIFFCYSMNDLYVLLKTFIKIHIKLLIIIEAFLM